MQKRMARVAFHMRRLGCGVCRLDLGLDHFCKDFEDDTLVQNCSELSALIRTFHEISQRDCFLYSARFFLRYRPTVTLGRVDYSRLVEANPPSDDGLFEDIYESIVPSFSYVHPAEDTHGISESAPIGFPPKITTEVENVPITLGCLTKLPMNHHVMQDVTNTTSDYSCGTRRCSLLSWEIPGNFSLSLLQASFASPNLERRLGYGCPGPPQNGTPPVG